MINQERWNVIGRKLGGLGASGRLQFTRGTIAACWVLENAPQGASVILVGFDNVHLGKTLGVEEGFPDEYVKQPSTFTFRGYIPNARKYGNHDFAIELPVMRQLAEDRGVQILFAQDIWQ
jgi:hypothetical protein